MDAGGVSRVRVVSRAAAPCGTVARSCNWRRGLVTGAAVALRRAAQEFFQLLARALFGARDVSGAGAGPEGAPAALFAEDEDSRALWFSPAATGPRALQVPARMAVCLVRIHMSDTTMVTVVCARVQLYELTGTLVGLAIFHGVMIDSPLPLAQVFRILQVVARVSVCISACASAFRLMHSSECDHGARAGRRADAGRRCRGAARGRDGPSAAAGVRGDEGRRCG